jgi:hypothetical protein
VVDRDRLRLDHHEVFRGGWQKPPEPH